MQKYKDWKMPSNTLSSPYLYLSNTWQNISINDASKAPNSFLILESRAHFFKAICSQSNRFIGLWGISLTTSVPLEGNEGATLGWKTSWYHWTTRFTGITQTFSIFCVFFFFRVSKNHDFRQLMDPGFIFSKRHVKFEKS